MHHQPGHIADAPFGVSWKSSAGRRDRPRPCRPRYLFRHRRSHWPRLRRRAPGSGLSTWWYWTAWPCVPARRLDRESRRCHEERAEDQAQFCTKSGSPLIRPQWPVAVDKFRKPHLLRAITPSSCSRSGCASRAKRCWTVTAGVRRAVADRAGANLSLPQDTNRCISEYPRRLGFAMGDRLRIAHLRSSQTSRGLVGSPLPKDGTALQRTRQSLRDRARARLNLVGSRD